MSLLVGERVWLDEEEALREQLMLLREECGATSLKVSTDDAGMGYDEIRTVHRLFHDILAIQAKIGGPEARQDMRSVVDIGCRSVVGPMIESGYSLQKFIESLKEELGEKVYGFIGKQINIETEVACRNLDEIFARPEISELDQITVGRTDLCRSLGREPNHPEVQRRGGGGGDAGQNPRAPGSGGGGGRPGKGGGGGRGEKGGGGGGGAKKNKWTRFSL